MERANKILLVDDEPDFTGPMASWFTSKGYSVTVVSRGEDALKSINDSPPDAIFLDIIMPNMDGYAVLKLIRTFNKTIPVIMISAYESKDKASQRDELSEATGFFNKNDDFSKALALVEQALKARER